MKPAIVKRGNSEGVRLTKHLLENEKLRNQPFKSIRERFQGFSEHNDVEAIDWGKPIGKEFW